MAARSAAAYIFAGILCACGNASATAPSVAILGQPTPSPTPFDGHLYVEYASSVGQPVAAGIAAFTLPISSQSTPAFTIAQPMGAISFDLYGNLFAIDQTQSTILEYHHPLTSASMPVTAVPSGPASLPAVVNDIGFDQNGNLWAETVSDLRAFVPPFGKDSVAQTIVPGGGANQIIFGPSGNLYAGVLSIQFGASETIRIYGSYPYTQPPKTLSSVPFGPPMAFYPDGTALISSTGANVVNMIPGTIEPPGLEVVNPSLSSHTTAQFIVPFTVTNQASFGHPAAIDQNGLMYILNGKRGNAIYTFNYPVLQGSVGHLALTCVRIPGGCMTPVGIYLGP